MLAGLYRSLYRIRRVEEEIARVYPTDVIKSPVHLSIGQEAVAVGVCDVLREEDAVFCSYRSHAAYLAKGGDLRAMIAELYGKDAGCGRGKAGSMHLVDASHGVSGASGVVGTTIPLATGWAYARKLYGAGPVAVSFFGDGAMEEGVFWESLNFAAVKHLPILFVCENNGYAIHSTLGARQPAGAIVPRVASFGVSAKRVPDNDVLAIREAVAALLPGLRERSSGPAFLECATYRWREHVGPNEDFDLGYRTRAEAAPWVAGDSMPRLGGLLPEDERLRIVSEVEEEVRDAFRFAEAAPWPEPGELTTLLYGEA